MSVIAFQATSDTQQTGRAKRQPPFDARLAPGVPDTVRRQPARSPLKEPALTLDANLLREIERNRLKSIVDTDLVVAESLHASNYQLITPRGRALTKDEYLSSIASGELDYRVFEPVSEIAVWGDDQIAILRYQAEIAFHGQVREEPFVCWHTDCYEIRDERWQAVWSQATATSVDEGR